MTNWEELFQWLCGWYQNDSPIVPGKFLLLCGTEAYLLWVSYKSPDQHHLYSDTAYPTKCLGYIYYFALWHITQKGDFRRLILSLPINKEANVDNTSWWLYHIKSISRCIQRGRTLTPISGKKKGGLKAACGASTDNMVQNLVWLTARVANDKRISRAAQPWERQQFISLTKANVTNTVYKNGQTRSFYLPDFTKTPK